MKSEQEQLTNRGYLIEGEESKYLCLSFDEKIKLLQSKTATDRTLGARLLVDSKENKVIEYLINALMIEKKLYSKIDICNSLVFFGQPSIKPLIAIFGRVGTNQHKRAPEKEFKKNNYPLPRDIASRTLVRIGKNALPELVKILDSENENQLSEAIDAIGFICFYDYTDLQLICNNEYRYNCQDEMVKPPRIRDFVIIQQTISVPVYKSEIYTKLRTCYLKNSKNDLIRWKIIRAMSGFSESKSFLQEQKQKLRDKRLIKEIERSLSLIKKRT
jgi:hypothetical protein